MENAQRAHVLADELRRFRQACEDHYRRATTARRNVPQNNGQAAILLNDTLSRIADTLEGIHDVLRYSVSLSLHLRASG